MASQRLMLSAPCRHVGVAAGTSLAALAMTVVGGNDGNKSKSDNGTRAGGKESTTREFPPTRSFFAPNMTLCDFRIPRVSRLARSRTIRRMEDTSTKETLRSKYDVQWKNPLGEGGFGAVYIATDRKTKEMVAVKKISKRLTDDASFQKEMNAFLHIRHKGGHPNICGLRENFDEGGCYYLVMDLVSGGEMFDHLINNGAYSEFDAARLVREVASALAFLHGIDIVHGDLKPENLMLSSKKASDAVIKVVDFGCAEVTDRGSPFFEAGTHIAANTPGYSAPEVIDKRNRLTQLAPSMDMFSIGVIVYIMLVGAHPFDPDGTATDEELNQQVLSKKGPPLRNNPMTAHLSPSAIDLIEKLTHWNPKKRLTAQGMLDHPWVQGETATTSKITDSDKRLSSYRKYKSRLEAAVFRSMVEWSDNANIGDIAKKTSLIERSFQMLDQDNKGYITTKELKRLDPQSSDSEEDDSQLSLSGFSDLLSENMKNRFFPAGHIVYKEGEKGDKMYFINSGRVEVSMKDGFKAVTEQGDFFGEGALLSKDGRRSGTIKCITPVHAIEISKQYFEKYLADGYDAELSVRERDKTRKRARAKAILASTKNMHQETFARGEYLYKQGEPGNELFILETGRADVMVDQHKVFEVLPGNLCGEHALVFSKPRNTSAVCAADECKVQVMSAKDFHKIKTHSAVKDSLRELTLRREFQKALVIATKRPFPTNESELLAAFDAADYNRSGKIDLSDVSIMLKNMDSTFSDKDIEDIMESLDIDGSGTVAWEEFKRIFGMGKKR